MLSNEFLRFSQTLNAADVPSDVRKMANLVWDNLDSIIPLGTTLGQRIRRIVELAQPAWDTLSSEIRLLPEQNSERVSTFSRLKKLSVGPFRGFARQEEFDLDSRLVLIYGPNGTGKSSFCEALEYTLLGSVAEAESKRFRNQSDYFRNAYVNQFSAPVITGVGAEGQDVAIEDNEAQHRFCFVEKNRIDSFSRIAALAPAKQTELISTLFGLDAFNDFVRNFTAEIDARYIDLTGVKAVQLAEKRRTLEVAIQQLKTGKAELEGLASEEQTLASGYREGLSFQQMMIELKGDEQNIGAIRQLETELQTPLPNTSHLTSTMLKDLSDSVETVLAALYGKQKQLAEASLQVSFKSLFEAVIELQSTSPEHCPACHTPLQRAIKNPYSHASEELLKLEFLSALQGEIVQLEKSLSQLMYRVSQVIGTCCQFLPYENVLERFREDNGITLWGDLHQPAGDGITPWSLLEKQVLQLEEEDKKTEVTAKLRESRQRDLVGLRESEHKITILQTRRNATERAIAVAQLLIDNFDMENRQLIEEVAFEESTVRKNKEISVAYAKFVLRLNAYKESLPQQLVANLGDGIVTLYNAFNRNDPPGEKFSDVKLPLMQNQRLEVAFQNNPTQYFDALHVLSEGHVRCIGLAILLAKNISEKCPLLVFDDPVNAIDDDHRESIRRTLFEDAFFADKQIILACHGEEFFKDIQNLLPAPVAAQSRTFSFLPRLDELHIRVDFNCAPRNYIISARLHYGRNEIREALTKCRQSLESLMKGKVWRYVNKHGDGNLSLKLRSATAPIELRNLSDQLKKQIGRADFNDPNKITVFSPIDVLTGFSGESREWRYLNKGTHDENDRAEFDRATVEAMIGAIEALDQAVG
ncbi:AAA family ATPase [Morganella morganii]|uniref:AAA family ATPase n=1 Tax=Morganella morganii TaxID=582 RepID=UPI000DCF0536|nr:AAA family ATPase [Morganella morganii]MBT0411885.1 AAA family ATPase [Morganella morganii subsp. morganii]MBV0430292.1 AAA family ATPase [Morganella morganii subsp. morganii]RAX25116.1 chromosome segregation protein SMC [Morganella morganii]GIZ28817.1 ATPase [Morganella morganii]GIZ31789.1 ATPase [Morganella morganii]